MQKTPLPPTLTTMKKFEIVEQIFAAIGFGVVFVLASMIIGKLIYLILAA